MHIKISREELLRGLSRMQSMVAKTTMQVLAHALIRTDDGDITITGTNLEMSSVGRYEADVLVEGDIVIPAKSLFEVVRSLPEGNIDILAEEGAGPITIKSGKSKYKLPKLPAAEFPTIPDMEGAAYYDFPGDIMRKLLNKTLFCISDKDTRYAMTGLFLTLKGNGTGYADVTAAGSDGHRISVVKESFPLGENLEYVSVIVPKSAVLEVAKLIKDVDTVQIAVNNNYLSIMLEDGFCFITRLIEGAYISYQQVIPTRNNNVLTADVLALEIVLKRVALFDSGVVLDLLPGRLLLSARSTNSGSAEEEIEVEYSGPAIKTGFNVRYLLDSLSAVNGKNASFFFDDALSPILMREKDDDTFIHLIMPMRVE